MRAGGGRRQRGAAALILLLVLILGAAAGMMSAYGGSGKAERERQAEQTLAQAQQALLGFAILHGRLPRPALSATDGRERATACDSEQACTGYLPWATLSLAPTTARGLPLRYSVTPAFAAPQTLPSAAVATKTISRRDAARLVYRYGDSQCGPTTQCLPAVLIAPGKAMAAAGSEAGDQAANARGSVHFIQRPLTEDERIAGGAFDDILAWVSYSELRTRMVLAGSWQ
ncbi:hypothetical protein GJ697_24535 [Pseudoduganella sp. FT25W]|uniref:Type II secretion system protein n=1 Tax=Duganella alba TaxID=2666081 RepID=A0A6L5QMV7_9BURK|nr:hypothetical protein [Duganella alba]MRX10995.1 hypothetical protein [Duganella alba]MRX19180.1 hypothetical protein [Duganella alba]